MQPISLARPASSPVPAAVPKKLAHVAEQFETVLLNDLLGPLEKSFSSLPGGDNLPGSSDYQYLGTQALASGLAASGGFGIAAMIVRNLMAKKTVTEELTAGKGAKVSLSGSR